MAEHSHPSDVQDQLSPLESIPNSSDSTEQPRSFTLTALWTITGVYAITGFSVSSVGVLLPYVKASFGLSTVAMAMVFPIFCVGLILGDFLAFYYCLASLLGQKTQQSTTNIHIIRLKKVLSTNPAGQWILRAAPKGNLADSNKQALLLGIGSAGTAFFLLSMIPTSSIIGFLLLLVFYALLGIGMSFIDVACNSITGSWGEGAGAALNLLHAGFGSGAVSFPLVFSSFVENFAWERIFLITGLFAIAAWLVALPVNFNPSLSTPSPSADVSSSNSNNNANNDSITLLSDDEVGSNSLSSPSSSSPSFSKNNDEETPSSPSSPSPDVSTGSSWSQQKAFALHLMTDTGHWMLVMAILFYVGAELVIGGWVPSLLLELGEPSYASVGTSLFWTGLLSGRLLLAIINHKVKATTGLDGTLKTLLVCSVLSVLSPTLLILFPRPPFSIFLTFLSGMSFAGNFPLIVTLASLIYADPITKSPNLSLSTLFVAANVGGLIFPFGVGAIANLSTIRIGMILGPLCMLGVSICCAVFTMKRKLLCYSSIEQQKQADKSIQMQKINHHEANKDESDA